MMQIRQHVSTRSDSGGASPGQRQSISAASAVNAKGAFWFCTAMMQYCRKPVHLVLDSLPAHKKAFVRDYVTSTKGQLTLHFLPGYARI